MYQSDVYQSAIQAKGVRVTVESTGAPIVRDADFSLKPGELLAVVGESGSGKTALALALLGFARPGTRIDAGEVLLEGVDLLKQSPSQMRRLLWERIALVPQDPGSSLNPATQVGVQLAEVLRAHGRGSEGVARRVARLLDSVGLPHDVKFQRRYPHQLSGGQQQRVAISMALACDPSVIVLDEPTTGLDVTTQAQVLALIQQVRHEWEMALFYVTHNLSVVSGIADRVAVMYGGTFVEIGRREDILTKPSHPYARMLIAAVPRLDKRTGSFVGIPGSAPGPGQFGSGCTFVARCPHRRPGCEQPQVQELVGDEHLVRCRRWRELEDDSPILSTPAATERPRDGGGERPLIRVRDVSASYRERRGDLRALESVSFDLFAGECIAVVGESGSGKSTLARCIAGLHGSWSGTVEFDGDTLPLKASKRSRDARRRIQIIFQNPDRSLNPSQRVDMILERPCRQLRGYSREDASRAARDLLTKVRLPTEYASKYPADLSGGERQRVAIARALAAGGDLLVICDEITSALDVSVQAFLLELLNDLRAQFGLSLLFISHDLAVVRSFADRIVVLKRGALCEDRETEALFARPESAYTRALLEDAPRL